MSSRPTSARHRPTDHDLMLSRQLEAQLRLSSGDWVLEHETDDVRKHYILGKQLGQPGQFGYALLAEHIATGQLRAVKVINKGKFTRSNDRKIHFKELRSEIDILSKMHHTNVITLWDVFETLNELFIVTELCGGGELFDRIKSQPRGSYSEAAAAGVLRQICSGIAYLHEHCIAHCDLKPDNFLFVDSSPDSVLKIIDFGMSKFVKRRQYFHSLRGTPYYIAPEVIQGQYNEGCDMWSLGVVMFVMLFGYPPFHADSDSEIFRLILQGFDPITKKGYKAHFPAAIPCSDAAKDLITKLLCSDTAKRITAHEALEHPWLTGVEASEKPMLDDVLRNLKNFSASCRFKAGILTLMTDLLSETEMNNLKRTFRDIDTNSDGQVSVSELMNAMERAGSKVTRQDVEKLLQSADIDGNGTLSYQELMLTSVQRKMNAKEERLWSAFCKVDVNRDGRLTVEEIQQVLGETGQGALKMIEEVDTDNDGRIDFEEFMNMWSAQAEAAEAQKFLNGNGGSATQRKREMEQLPPGTEIMKH